jgi:hypothetical protein
MSVIVAAVMIYVIISMRCYKQTDLRFDGCWKMSFIYVFHMKNTIRMKYSRLM